MTDSTKKRPRREVAADTWPKPLKSWCQHRNVSERTAYREAADNRLTFTKIRSSNYVTQESDAAYMASLVVRLNGPRRRCL